jgi:nucleotide-binding universal stress UspA family protein
MSPFAPKSILAATDFSEISTWALRHAGMWAQGYGARLIVLHVTELAPAWNDPYVGSFDLTGLVEASRAAAGKELERSVQEHVPPVVAVSRELLAGSPPVVIEEYVAGGRVDLVVLGTHGRGGISRLLLGSVAERTLRMARHPTLIVRQPNPEKTSAGAEGSGAAGPHLRRILCPVNDTSVARLAFEHACSVARTFGAHLTTVFVAEPGHDTQAPEVRQRLEERLKSWMPTAVRSEFTMQTVVRRGDAAREAIDLARELAADLVVIGAQHRRFVDTTVLGVTTVRVTRHAPCPVLVVPRSEGSE